MTWPTPATKTNSDQGGDDPKQALLVDLPGVIDKFNLAQAHVTAFMQTLLSRVTPAAVRDDLGAVAGVWPVALGGTGTTDGGGLGALDPSLPPNNNLNDVIKTGWVKTDGSTANRPAAGTIYLVHSIRLSATSLAQLAFRPDTDLDLALSGPFWRASEGGSWIGWKRLPFDRASQAQAEAGAVEHVFIDPLRMTQGLAARFVDASVADLSAGSPASHDLTGLAGAHRIAMSIGGLSLSGTDELHLLLGDAGGFETAGYSGSVWGLGCVETGGGFLGHPRFACGGWGGGDFRSMGISGRTRRFRRGSEVRVLANSG